MSGGWSGEPSTQSDKGRWPANVIHDGSPEVVGMFPSTKTNATGKPKDYQGMDGRVYGNYSMLSKTLYYQQNSGSAARFFYCAKANKRERGQANNHPTVKPLDLMRYLINLVTYPKGNLILDPFCGSGSTLLASKIIGVDAVGVEMDPKSYKTAKTRIGKPVEIELDEDEPKKKRRGFGLI